MILDIALANFVDDLESSGNELDVRNAANRFADRLGFRWFAYLGFSGPALKVLSSYPSAWSRHYTDHKYEMIDPIIGQARSCRTVFRWNCLTFRAASRPERKFFSEASDHRIRHGVTVPINGGFGRFAMFTLASDAKTNARISPGKIADAVYVAGLYCHSHVYAKLHLALRRSEHVHLTARELQCLEWAARGKNMPDTGLILGISTRTVVFHLGNARSKLGASTVTQAAIEAERRGLIVC